jgi:hypothetical protein
MKLYFSCSSPNDDGINYIAKIEYLLNRTFKIEKDAESKFGDTITFDIFEYLSKFSLTAINTV